MSSTLRKAFAPQNGLLTERPLHSIHICTSHRQPRIDRKILHGFHFSFISVSASPFTQPKPINFMRSMGNGLANNLSGWNVCMLFVVDLPSSECVSTYPTSGELCIRFMSPISRYLADKRRFIDPRRVSFVE